ncbi:MAG: TIM barrel protein, partial [Pseudomonadota bacterium]
MKIGMNMLLWTGFVDESHFDLFETLKKTGFDGAEIPTHHGDVAHYQRLGQAARNAGLECTTTTVLPDLDHHAVSADAKARQGALDHVRWAIDRCEAMGSIEPMAS